MNLRSTGELQTYLLVGVDTVSGLQVGFIANLKHERMHKILSQVTRPLLSLSIIFLLVFVVNWDSDWPIIPSCLQAVTALSCMEHRGACSADQISGDGAGIMTQIPWDLFKQDLPDLNEQDTGYVFIIHALILITLIHPHSLWSHVYELLLVQSSPHVVVICCMPVFKIKQTFSALQQQ